MANGHGGPSILPAVPDHGNVSDDSGLGMEKDNNMRHWHQHAGLLSHPANLLVADRNRIFKHLCGRPDVGINPLLGACHCAACRPFHGVAEKRPEDYFKGTNWWLEEQEAEMTRDAEKTVPITLWINRAKSWDIKTRDYGDGCFAFASTSGPPDAGNRQAYHFAAIICAKDRQSIPVDTRGVIASSFSVTHEFYKPPFRSE